MKIRRPTVAARACSFCLVFDCTRFPPQCAFWFLTSNSSCHFLSFLFFSFLPFAAAAWQLAEEMSHFLLMLNRPGMSRVYFCLLVTVALLEARSPSLKNSEGICMSKSIQFAPWSCQNFLYCLVLFCTKSCFVVFRVSRFHMCIYLKSVLHLNGNLI